MLHGSMGTKSKLNVNCY